MKNSKLLERISKKESDKNEIAQLVIDHPELLDCIFAGLDNEMASIKYGCDKILRIISEKEPKLLYPKIDYFIEQIDSENSFLKWGAIHIIAYLAFVDSKNKFEKIFDKYFEPIPGPVLITAANTIKLASVVAIAKPKLTAKITTELLKVEKAQYQTSECHNIALGHMIKAFGLFFPQIKNKKPVIKLIKQQLNNPRNATKKKAEDFLKKYKIEYPKQQPAHRFVHA